MLFADLEHDVLDLVAHHLGLHRGIGVGGGAAVGAVLGGVVGAVVNGKQYYRDTRGYVYRLVLTHESEGKLALDWDAKINDDYVFATVPKALEDKESDLFKIAKQLGEALGTPPADGGKVAESDSILDKFKEVIDIITKN